MTDKEYKDRLDAIESDYVNAKKKLYVDYGMSRVIFDKGSIIKDERFAIRIDKIYVHKSFDMPQPVYEGYELKKDLSPRKDGSRQTIFGNKAELIKK